MVSASGGSGRQVHGAFCSLPLLVTVFISPLSSSSFGDSLPAKTGFSAEQMRFKAGSNPLLGRVLEERSPSGHQGAWQAPQNYSRTPTPGGLTLSPPPGEQTHYPWLVLKDSVLTLPGIASAFACFTGPVEHAFTCLKWARTDGHGWCCTTPSVWAAQSSQNGTSVCRRYLLGLLLGNRGQRGCRSCPALARPARQCLGQL